MWTLEAAHVLYYSQNLLKAVRISKPSRERERENNLNSGKVGRAVLPTQFLRIHKSSAPRASSVEGAHATTTSTCPKSLANILNAVMACFAAVPL